MRELHHHGLKKLTPFHWTMDVAQHGLAQSDILNQENIIFFV